MVGGEESPTLPLTPSPLSLVVLPMNVSLFGNCQLLASRYTNLCQGFGRPKSSSYFKSLESSYMGLSRKRLFTWLWANSGRVHHELCVYLLWFFPARQCGVWSCLWIAESSMVLPSTLRRQAFDRITVFSVLLWLPACFCGVSCSFPHLSKKFPLLQHRLASLKKIQKK